MSWGQELFVLLALQVSACAAKVLEELVVRQQDVLRAGNALTMLPMLPGTPRLAEINAILEQERGDLPLAQRVDLLAESLKAASLAVRNVALKELQKLARGHRSEMCDLFLQAQPGSEGEGGAARTASRLYGALLQVCPCMGQVNCVQADRYYD